MFRKLRTLLLPLVLILAAVGPVQAAPAELPGEKSNFVVSTGYLKGASPRNWVRLGWYRLDAASGTVSASMHRHGDQYLEALEQHVLPGDFVVVHVLGVDAHGAVQPASPGYDGASHPVDHGGAYPGSRSGIEQPLYGL